MPLKSGNGMSVEYVVWTLAMAVVVLSNRPTTKLTALLFVGAALASGDTFRTACAISVASCAVKLVKYFISPPLRVSAVDLTGRTVIVTGATSGCGKETARLLYAWNATVILACRDLARGERAAREIRNSERKATTGQLVVEYLDLASQKSVRAFARRFQGRGLPLNMLINNAGVRTDSLQKTDDDIELHYQVNHLGHYLLTRLLLDALEDGAAATSIASRVVHVSSSAHSFGAVPESVYAASVRNTDLGLFRERMAANAEGVYGDTKLMQVLFSNELDRRMLCEKRSIRSYAVHPGFVDTHFGASDKRWLQTLLVLTRPFFARDPQQVCPPPLPPRESTPLFRRDYPSPPQSFAHPVRRLALSPRDPTPKDPFSTDPSLPQPSHSVHHVVSMT